MRLDYGFVFLGLALLVPWLAPGGAAASVAESPARTASVDVTAPEITLEGDASVTIPYGQGYTGPGATASDNCDGDLTGSIVTGGDTVSAATPPGEYTITYNVSDAAGNTAQEAVRNISVTSAEGEAMPAEGEGEATPAEGEGEATPTEGEGEIIPTEGEGEGEATPTEGEVLPDEGETPAGAVVISMPDINVARGREALLPISVSSADRITPDGISISLEIDSLLVEPGSLEVERTALTGELSLTSSSPAPGQVRIEAVQGGALPPRVSGEAHMFFVRFRAPADLALGTCGTARFTRVRLLSISGSEVVEVPVDARDTASLCVAEENYLGDLSGDGIVDAEDTLLSLLVATGQRGIDELELTRTDLNGDGRIDSADAVMLQNLAVGAQEITPELQDRLLVGLILRDRTIPRIEVGSTSGMVGEVLSIPVSINDQQGIAGYDFTLTFDPDVFEVEDVIEGSVKGDGRQEVRTAPGQVQVSVGRPRAHYDEKKQMNPGTLATVRLRVVDRPSGGDNTTLRLVNTALKGQYGDDFAWFEDLRFTNGNLRIAPPAAEALLEQFEEEDADQNGGLSFAEAQEVVSSLTRAEFDALDIDASGELSRSELAGAAEGEGEGEDAAEGEATGCGFCNEGGKTLDLKRYLGDLYLTALSLLALLLLSGLRAKRR